MLIWGGLEEALRHWKGKLSSHSLVFPLVIGCSEKNANIFIGRKFMIKRFHTRELFPILELKSWMF